MHILEDDTLDNQIQSSVLFPLWNFELHGVLPPSLSELFDRAKESSSPRLRLRIAQLELFSLLSTATEDEPSDDMLQHARVILDCLRQDPNLALLAPGSFGMFLNPELLRENEDVFRVMLTSADIHVRTVAISIVSESISRMGRFQSKERINELTAIYAGWSAVIKEAGMPGPNDQQADADWLKELCDDVVRSLETDSSDAS